MSLTAKKSQKKTNNVPGPQVTNQSLLLKDEELRQLDQLLDQIPHGYAKQIVIFFQLIRQKRTAEATALKQQLAKKAETESKN